MQRPSLFTISLVTVLAGVFIGIGIGAIVSPIELATTQPSTPPSGTNNAQIAGAAISTFCPEGFMWYEGFNASYCYPQELTLLTEDEKNAQFFFAPNEELVAEFTDVKKVPIHLCNRGRRVQVAGIDAMRITIREPLASGCGEIVAFATTIDSKPIPLFIRLAKTDGTALSLDRYIAIEQSIELAAEQE